MGIALLRHRHQHLIDKELQKQRAKQPKRKLSEAEKRKQADYQRERRERHKREHQELLQLRESKEEKFILEDEAAKEFDRAPYRELVRSKAFNEAILSLTGVPWEQYRECELFYMAKPALVFSVLLESIRLKKQFGKYFDFKKAERIKLECFAGREFSSDDFLSECVHAKAIAMASLSELPAPTRRRLKQAFATPAWRDRAAIRSIYERRSQMSEADGIIYHVDHVIPIQGEFVCGLHVASNLQIIPASENIVKGNKF